MPDKPLTKLEQWNAIPMAAQWLTTTLAGEMGQFFLSVLEERHPVRLNRALSAADHTTKGTALSASMTGYEQCLQQIRDLSNPAAAAARQLKPNYGVTDQNATE